MEKHRGTPAIVNILYHVATTLEVHTKNLLTLEYMQAQQWFNQNSKPSYSAAKNYLSSHKSALLHKFYQQPTIQIPKKHRSRSIYSQIISKPPTPVTQQNYNSNNYSILDQAEQEIMTMVTDTTQQENQDMEEDEVTDYSKNDETETNYQHKKPKLTKKWEADPTISQLSATFLTNLQVEQEKLQEAGEDLKDAPQYKAPTDATELIQQQQIRLSLCKARNSDSQPTLKLFKSFASALKSDPSSAILPVNMSKQNLPSLSTSAKIQAMDNNKVFTYFKNYYPNQKTTLSGYIHALTNLCFEDLSITPPIYEWLGTNRYTIRECPSHEEEMVQVGALCFGSEFIYRKDLKEAIQVDPGWKFPHLRNPPVIQLTRGEFWSSKKSKKMIFIHTKKSKQHDVTQVLTRIYDGTSKAYPNGNMMLFIPLHDNIQLKATYRHKVAYNHEQFLGEEMALAIHGLQDVEAGVTLKNGQKITIRMLIRGLPATQGMNRPQLFQLAETNATRDSIIVTYQKGDKDHVNA
jgi:hypothetical protein